MTSTSATKAVIDYLKENPEWENTFADFRHDAKDLAEYTSMVAAVIDCIDNMEWDNLCTKYPDLDKEEMPVSWRKLYTAIMNHFDREVDWREVAEWSLFHKWGEKDS